MDEQKRRLDKTEASERGAAESPEAPEGVFDSGVYSEITPNPPLRDEDMEGLSEEDRVRMSEEDKKKRNVQEDQ